MNGGEKLGKFKAFLIRERKGKQTIRGYLGVAKSYAIFCRGKSFNSPQDAVCAFLSTYSTRNLSVSSQDHALNALAGKCGLYAALGKPLGRLPSWVKAKKPIHVPTWVTQAETERIAEHLKEPWSLMTLLMFGAGLRIHEVVSLRWRDLDFERMTITVKQSKGKKDRITFLPSSVAELLRARYRYCRGLWCEDRQKERPGVQIPTAVANKSPRAGEQWAFFWVFPAAGESRCPNTRIQRRHHIHEKSLNKPVRIAVSRAGIAKRVTAHSYRHGFATAYLLAGGNIRELKDLMGHKSIQTTEIYLHCLPSFTDRVGSPLDRRDSVVPFVPMSPATNPHRKAL
jgi:integrase